MNATPVDNLATALDAVGEMLADVREDQWHAPTPCIDWDVREVVNHLVLGDDLTSEVLCGGPGLGFDAFDPKARDGLGEDPVASYRSASVKLVAALRQPDVPEQVFQLPIGPVPGVVILRLRTTETLVHGWDVARATGQRLSLPDQLVFPSLEFSREMLASADPATLPLAAPQPVADDAPALDRLVALLGRPADWPG